MEDGKLSEPPPGAGTNRQIHPLAIHEYGDLRVGEDFDRFAAENNCRNTTTPV